MTTSQTLLQMAGAPTGPPPLADSTLVVIDAQREYLDGALPLPDVEQAVASIARLLAAAREAGAPVVHVHHVGAAGALFDPARGGAAIDAVAPAQGEVVVTKTLPNAFAGTTLEESIDGRPLVLCGFMTHMCVSSTARAALDLGRSTTVVADACGTRDLPDPVDPDAVAVTHDVLHRAALAALSDRFSTITTTTVLTGG